MMSIRLLDTEHGGWAITGVYRYARVVDRDTPAAHAHVLTQRSNPHYW